MKQKKNNEKLRKKSLFKKNALSYLQNSFRTQTPSSNVQRSSRAAVLVGIYTKKTNKTKAAIIKATEAIVTLTILLVH